MRLAALLVPLLLLTHVATAAAQGVEVRDHRHHGPPPGAPPAPVVNVSSYAPQTGPIGTLVTITGSGFNPSTKIYVAGRKVPTISVTPTTISFKIPPRTMGNGAIELRMPPNITIPVGNFAVLSAPGVVSFTPTQGPAGTQVIISGSGFLPGDEVYLSGMKLGVVAQTASQITVTIPVGATSGVFNVTRPSANMATSSRQKFIVTLPGPTVSSINPVTGPPGATVRIAGANLPPDSRVFYGPQPTRVLASGPTWLDVQVPVNAKASLPFRIRTAYGAVETQVFTLQVPTTVVSITPTQGPLGTTVVVRGSGYGPTDNISINGVAQSVTARTDRSISFQVAAGTTSGKVQVIRGGTVVAESASVFTVKLEPVITGASPTSGPVGTQIVVTGSGFPAGTTVTLGTGFELPTVAGNDNRIVATVTAGAPASARIWIHLPDNRRYDSKVEFKLTKIDPVITSASPASGGVGTQIVVTGSGFPAGTTVQLGNFTLPTVSGTDTQIVASVVAGAPPTSHIWIRLPDNRRYDSKVTFTVAAPTKAEPQITGASPTYGSVGTQIIVTGSGFPAGTSVQLGTFTLPTVSGNDTRIVASVVQGAPPVAHIWIRLPDNRRYDSKVEFKIQAPPPPPPTPQAIALKQSPDSGPVGTQVTINMENGTFAGSNLKVWFGAKPCNVVSTSPNRIVVVIPPGASGTDYLVVDMDNVRRRPATKFTVTPAGSVVVPTKPSYP